MSFARPACRVPVLGSSCRVTSSMRQTSAVITRLVCACSWCRPPQPPSNTPTPNTNIRGLVISSRAGHHHPCRAVTLWIRRASHACAPGRPPDGTDAPDRTYPRHPPLTAPAPTAETGWLVISSRVGHHHPCRAVTPWIRRISHACAPGRPRTGPTPRTELTPVTPH